VDARKEEEARVVRGSGEGAGTTSHRNEPTEGFWVGRGGGTRSTINPRKQQPAVARGVKKGGGR